MTSNNSSSAIRAVCTALKSIGADLPKPVAQAIADLETLTTAVASIKPPTAEDVFEAAADAILDGRNPFDDEQVRALTAARNFSGSGALQEGIKNAGQDRIAQAMTANADTLVGILKEAVDAAGKKLTAAHAILGDVDLEDSETILQMGTKAAAAWVQAKTAIQTIDNVIPGWYWLAELTRFANASIDPSFRLADLDLDTIEKVGRKANAWAIVKAGGTIDLATRTTAKQRPEAYAKALTARGNDHAAAYQKAVQRVYGSAPIHI
jgi:flagellar hook-basal body complex protein FliE